MLYIDIWMNRTLRTQKRKLNRLNILKFVVFSVNINFPSMFWQILEHKTIFLRLPSRWLFSSLSANALCKWQCMVSHKKVKWIFYSICWLLDNSWLSKILNILRMIFIIFTLFIEWFYIKLRQNQYNNWSQSVEMRDSIILIWLLLSFAALMFKYFWK